MLDLLVGILHLVVFPGGLFALALGLFLKGCDRRVEARLQRRVGPPLIQPFLDLVKLSTKEVIIPTSAVRGAFLAAPVVALGGIAMCAALLPVPGVTDGLPKMGDLLVIFYLFPIPAMAIMLAGSSSGSPYGGIGFSREMIMMLAYEVPLLMIMLTVAMKVGGGSGAEFSLTKIMDYQAEHGSFGLTPVMWPAFLAWLMFLPRSACRPSTSRKRKPKSSKARSSNTRVCCWPSSTWPRPSRWSWRWRSGWCCSSPARFRTSPRSIWSGSSSSARCSCCSP